MRRQTKIQPDASYSHQQIAQTIPLLLPDEHIAYADVRFTVLASRSKCNRTVVSGGRTRILLDCGLSCRELFRRMRLMDGVRRLREEAGPNPVLVSIGGITLATAAEAFAAGASVVATAGAIFRQPDPATEFRRWVAELG